MCCSACCCAAAAAATELLLLLRSGFVALILRVASLDERHDTQNDETTGIHFPPCLFKFKESLPTILGRPLAP